MAMECGLSLLFLTLAAPPGEAEDWKVEAVWLKNGHSFVGLIVEETRDSVRMRCVIRKPGARTLTFPTTFNRNEVDRIERLAEEDRRQLAERIQLLDPRGEREATRMKELVIEAVTFNGNGKGWRYAGKSFRLEANVKEELVRRVVVRLEDIFQAYTERLGTRREPKPNQVIQIVLCKSWSEYETVLKDTGLEIRNPAHYNPAKNRIVVVCDLEDLADQLDKVRRKHEGHLQEVGLQERKLRMHFHGNPPQAMVARLQQVRQSIEAANNENEAAFDTANRRLFATLYHEAFHAYLDNYVYPSSEVAVPRWLNEGLAQIFETALVETGELRVGHVDQKRLTAVREALRRKDLLPLTELLGSEPKHFAVSHVSTAQESDRHYQAAWALAYYLTFEKKLLNSPAMHDYVQAVSRGTNRLDAFATLVGRNDLAAFEAEFHDYLRKLRADGTVRPADGKMP